MRRTAITTRTAPSAIFTASAASEGTVLGLGGLLPVATTVTVTTMARDTSHPNTKAAPFRVPCSEGSTTRNAVRQRVERYRHADQDQVEDHGRVSGLIEAEVALMLDTR